MAAHEGLVISDGIAVPVIFHEEDVGHVEFPDLMLGAELS